MAFGFNLEVVGARRFELPTPSPPEKCATRLRYAPTDASNHGSEPFLQRGIITAAAKLRKSRI